MKAISIPKDKYKAEEERQMKLNNTTNKDNDADGEGASVSAVKKGLKGKRNKRKSTDSRTPSSTVSVVWITSFMRVIHDFQIRIMMCSYAMPCSWCLLNNICKRYSLIKS